MGSDQDAPDAVLDAFFRAIERGDLAAVDRIYADDVEVWHNVTGRTLDKAACLAMIGHWARTVPGMRYEVLDRHPFDGGAVQRHVLRGVLDGAEIAAPICVVAHVEGGRITRIYEYLDGAAVAAVFAARPS